MIRPARDSLAGLFLCTGATAFAPQRLCHFGDLIPFSQVPEVAQALWRTYSFDRIIVPAVWKEIPLE